MEDTRRLLRAMAQKAKTVIEASKASKSDLPVPLQPKHLRRMCDRLEKDSEDCPITKLTTGSDSSKVG